jgi:hypothetical protein
MNKKVKEKNNPLRREHARPAQQVASRATECGVLF